MLYLDFLLGILLVLVLCCLKIICLGVVSFVCLFWYLSCFVSSGVPRSGVFYIIKFWNFLVFLFKYFCCFFLFWYSNYPYITPFELPLFWCSVVFAFWSFFYYYYYYFCISFWEVSADLASNSLTFSECWVYWWGPSKAFFISIYVSDFSRTSWFFFRVSFSVLLHVVYFPIRTLKY